jgi:hypothetical protein
MPPSLDQTAGYQEPLMASQTVTIAAGPNELRIDLSAKR